MTRVTMKVKKTHHEASAFESKPLPKKSDLSQTSSRAAPKRPNTFETNTTKNPKNPRFSKFVSSNERKMTCFGCRKSGHSLKNCTETKEIEVKCYHCGSDEHTTKNCPTPGKTFPFATCFICQKVGHLSSKCPQNEKGMYPNGGSCKFCGSVYHLARNCKPTDNKEATNTIGLVDLHHGGDDDDVFVALKNIQDEKNQNKINRANKKPKKKVVNF
ncbi:hypothetical protein AYI70_g7840 [Smittium culicis]|uniref:CCHC-type domain-containing protein n=1 Tax=Smittium culicis TaxID=133412 RepID=A0A1R1XIL5_9FUNG|nr:hypothetical protein AYI70_g7840 [Smittium culicis]